MSSSPIEDIDAAFRAVFDGTHDAMMIADDEGRYLDVNAAACRLFGRTRDELRRMSVVDIGADREATLFAWQTFLSLGTATGEWFLKVPGGERILSYTSYSNISPGQHLFVLHDVTELRRTQAALRRAEETFAKAFRANPAALLIVSLADRRIVDANPAAAALVGRAREDLLGTTADACGLGSDLDRLLASLDEAGSARDVRCQAGRATASAELVEVGGEVCALVVMLDVPPARSAHYR